MQASIALADSFFKSKGVATSSEGTLMAGALLLQLIMMGARLTQQGYGGHNLIVDIKKAKGKQKQLKKPKSKSSDKAEQIELKALEDRIGEMSSDEKARIALSKLDFSDDSW
jgi:hypothetical protein